MADEKKKISLGGIDNAAEEKGSFIKTVWQFVKFLVVSGLVTIIQLVLANVLPLIFDSVTATLPGFLQGIFKPDVIFDASTAQGAKQIAKYVVGGVVTWGYLLPFFLSNLIANIYGFYQNKKTTFKSDAPWYNFAIYIVLMIALILFSTWFQGWLVGIIAKAPWAWLNGLARTIAGLAAGFVQMVVLFPMEKFVLLKEKKEEKVMELMDAVDNWIELPTRAVDKPFLMPVEDVFSITGRGTVATGRIEAGVIHVGDEVEILGLGEDKKSVVTGVEMFRKLLDQGEAGDNVGLLLRGIDKNEIKRGMILCKPGQVKAHSKFKAEVYILKKEEGGRHTPFHNKYRPQFYLRTMDCTGEITLPEGTEMVMPGDNVTITVELIYPVALNVGLRFAIREGGRTVGAGQITELLD